MGLGDIFKAGENQRLKSEVTLATEKNEKLTQRISELEDLITPEMRDIETANKKLAALKEEIKAQEQNKQNLLTEITAKEKELHNVKEVLIETNEAVLLQEFGLYEPKYAFATSEEYASKLQKIREQQKAMIKEKTAASGSNTWTVNGNAAKGKKMISDMQKLLLRAFNNECDDVISKVKFNNIETAEKRISTSKNVISKLGAVMGVAITDAYYDLKIKELFLAYEYQLKKQEEKEEQRRIREELREQAKLQKEIDEARKKIEKDKKHYEKALQQAQEKLNTETNETKKADLSEKIELFEEQLAKISSELKEVDYREANQRAGYVYIISNIGAFGENVYKIGMTRRLDPMDRVDELGDASVPFKFDVHAMIFTEDAPKLETALHHAFENKKVNMVNNRREFFHVSLDEIKKVVRENYDKTVEFVDIPDAEQYRQSLLMRNTTTG